MRLYIQIKNGDPINHPLLEDNVKQVWPDIDLENPPISELARFIRIPVPVVGAYEVYQGVTYEWTGDAVSDVHHIRPMTHEERAAKQQDIKQSWIDTGGWTSWTFDPDICDMVPPVPHPDDGGRYRWDEPTLSWEVVKNIDD